MTEGGSFVSDGVPADVGVLTWECDAGGGLTLDKITAEGVERDDEADSEVAAKLLLLAEESLV